MGNKIVSSKSILKEIGSWIMILVYAIVIAFIIRSFVFITSEVSGNSMNPSFNHGDKLIVTKIDLIFRKPKAGDVIVFKSPINNKDDYIKRVIAVEGDEVRIEDGIVYVNGSMIDELYIEPGVETLTDGFNNMWQVGKDKLFVLGDNRRPGKSTDSRYFGEISRDIVVGHVVFRYFPFNRIKIIN